MIMWMDYFIDLNENLFAFLRAKELVFELEALVEKMQ